MTKTKTDLIKEFLAKNPDATASDLPPALKKQGVTAGYFSVIKSKLNNPKSKKIGGRKTVRRRVPGATGGMTELQSVAALAKEVGGLDRLAELVETLRQVQI